MPNGCHLHAIALLPRNRWGHWLAYITAHTLTCLVGIALFGTSSAQATQNHTLRLAGQTTERQQIDIGLTDEERAWLRQHPVIRVGVRHGYTPIEYISEGNQFRGITVDYLGRLEYMLNVEFKLVDYMDSPLLGTIDVLSGVTNPQAVKNQGMIALDRPFLSFPYAIYTHKLNKDIQHYSDLESKKIAVFKKSAVTPQLTSSIKSIEVVNMEIAEDAFYALENGEVDAYVGNAFIVDYVASSQGVTYIKKVGDTPFQAEISMAVRQDWPELKSILQKSLTALEPEKSEILRKWDLAQYKENIRTLVFLLIALALIALYVLFKSYRLKQTIRLQNKLSQERIWHQANFDYLTNLPNRMMFHNRLQEEIKKSDRSALPLGLLFIDLDNFKQINDQLGHPVGDELIIQVSKRISGCVRSIDTTARIGGDEFTVIMGEISDLNSLEKTSRKIMTRLEAPFQIQDHDIYVTASIGITVYPNDTKKLEELVMFADQAMYEAKRLGRNRYHFFTASMQAASVHRHTITNDLRTALAERKFEIYYQPIIDLSNDSLYKAEALIRWQHPAKGMIMPAEFIAIAEETGMIEPIGNWVFEKVLEDVAMLRKSCHPDYQISFNVSPKQFMDEANLLSWLDRMAARDLPGNTISVEITEGLLLQATSSVKHVLSRFIEAGAEISIDDFGTGYSALGYLKKFDVDYVKLDKSFIHNIESDHDTRVLCEAIISMAHKLKIKVIAEGIETLAQQALLKKFGCDYGQGYLLAKPMNIKDFIKLNHMT